MISWRNTLIQDESGAIVGTLSSGEDITGRKQTEIRTALARDVLARLNNPKSTTDTIRDILQMVRKSMDFEAVGIRLSEGEDYPYYQTNGFPDHFVEMERYICARDEKGTLVRDEAGNVVLECMCGDVLCGRTNPELPFFTEGGSFWSNCTSELFVSTTEADHQGHKRNRCNEEGYESVALIPLRTGAEILGLLQLNDHRRNRLTPELIRFFEGLGDSIGIVIARKHAEEELATKEKKWRTLFETMREGVFYQGADGVLIDVNDAALRMFGLSRDEFLSRTSINSEWDVIREDGTPLPGSEHPSMLALRTGKPAHDLVVGIFNPQIEGYAWVSVSAIPEFLEGDTAPYQVVVTMHDITLRKRAEERLHAAHELNQSTLDALSAHIAILNADGTILAVNRAWMKFSKQNGLKMPDACIGANYLAVSEAATGEWAQSAKDAAEGIRAVADGILDRFVFEYPCHSPEENRWFFMRVTPLQDARPGRVVVSHENITNRKLVEEALKDSERRFRTVVETIPDLVWLKNPEGVYLTCNHRFSDFFGAIESEIAGKTDYDFGSREQADLFREHDLRAMEAGGPSRNEEWVTFASDGHCELLETIKTPVRDGDGNLIGVLGIGRDITERKKAEEALRKSEGLFRKVFEVLPVGLWIANKDGTLMSGNPAGVRIWGRSPLVDLSKYGVFKARRLPSGEEITPDDWALAHTVKEGVTILDELLEIDAFDGVTRTILNSTAPVLDDNGNIEAAIVVNRDITRIKEAEDAVRSSERDLAEAQRIARIGSWVWDVETGAMRWSDELFRIFGVDGQEPNLALVKSLVHPEDVQAWEQALRMAFETKASLNIDYRALCPDGRMIWIHIEAKVIQDENGRIVSLQGTAQDITERKIVEEAITEQLAELQRWHEVTLNREDRVIELKKEVNGLLSRLGHDPKYQSVQE